jgi:hypothetical protein
MELGNMLFGNSRGDFAVDRGLQDLFVDALKRAGFDDRGFRHGWESDRPAPPPYNEQATATHHFVIQPYVMDELDNAVICPNFFDRVTGLKLRWYKYVLRDSYANYDLTEEMLVPILQRLVEECVSHGATSYLGDD